MIACVRCQKQLCCHKRTRDEGDGRIIPAATILWSGSGNHGA
ncbi:Hypothetical protein GbCGDNIH9_8744 [Granulibacter bethesdensis]|uniref:Uncharacterized protein n=1 Tax=Granulibacter bethesdensis TaxID=364410 RepID=A0AAC9P989_9PROT|nr:Hypothetical protein GbCGDNIH9_8744 [Granulibacter bethesdensis]